MTCFHSTREIKPNQGDIGRKITKKPSAITSSLYNRTTTSGQTSSITPNSPISNGKRLSDSSERGLSSGESQQQLQLQSSMSSHLTSQPQISATNSLSYDTSRSQDHHHDPYQHGALNGVVGDDVDRRRIASPKPFRPSGGQQNHRIPDIVRKPIK